MDTMRQKVIKALVEGEFIKKTINKIETRTDRYLGIWAKKLVFSNEQVQKNKIFFMTFQGDYTCNPKYITEELIKENIDCDIIWGVRLSQLNRPDLVPNKVRMVNRYTYDFYKEMATSKIWIINSVEVFKNPLLKKKNQILMETWHGSLGIKRFDKDANSGREWVKAAELCGNMADYCVSNSDFEDEVFRETFWLNTPILKYGHPRNDILFLEGKEKLDIIKKVMARYDLEEDVHYILYGPTFRDSHHFNCYNLAYNSVIEAAENKFGGRWKILVRFHPTVREFSQGVLEGNEDVIDVTDYPDIQELMVLADMAITDYSSWIYDFVLTRKPGFIYAPDLDDYNNERGFYYKLESTPFPVARSNRMFIKNITDFDVVTYKANIKKFLADKGCVEDGHASERVVHKIMEIMEETK